MSKNPKQYEAQNPLILRYHRLMDTFSKSDDERDFYLDKREGFIIYVDLDRVQEELEALEKVLEDERFHLIPKLTFYETKKIMEGFINEKIYDIDIKEKLADIIQSKEARENFLEFVYDHDVELEKWQQFYQERSRVRIIEWLRKNDFNFVFEEDLDLAPSLIEKVKQNLFNEKVPKDVATARQLLDGRAKVYYSNEALNPRPKRGRPPKQVAKVEIAPQFTHDFYVTVPSQARAFLYIPEISNATSITFSSKFDTEEEFRAQMKTSPRSDSLVSLESISKKLSSLSDLSKKVSAIEGTKGSSKSTLSSSKKTKETPRSVPLNLDDYDDDEDDFDDEDEDLEDDDFDHEDGKSSKEKGLFKKPLKKDDRDKKKY
jgi:hypothetical protein